MDFFWPLLAFVNEIGKWQTVLPILDFMQNQSGAESVIKKFKKSATKLITDVLKGERIACVSLALPNPAILV